MAFVVDASVTTCWLMPDESDALASLAYARLDRSDFVVPAIWWFETRNVLVTNERRGRIAGADLALAHEILTELPVVIDREPNETQLVGLARRHRLTVYDAAYLELALRRAVPLVTLDAALARAAAAERVELLGA